MSIKLLFTGDFCPIGRAVNYINKENFDGYLGDVQYLFEDNDLNIVNLESPLTESSTPINKTGPNIKAPFDSIKLLKALNIDIACLANNHIMDYGVQGLKDSIEICQQNNIETLGAGENYTEARKGIIKNIKGKNIGFYNVAENEFCTTTGNEPGANPVDSIENFYDIQALKEKCDFLIVMAHGGREHYQLPTPNVQKRYRFYIDAGANAVIGHHPHCYSGMENYNEGVIFYSLGNFIFDYKKKYQRGKWTEAIMVQLILDEDLNVTHKIHPFSQGREANPSLELMKEKNLDSFEETFSSLNTIISNTELMNLEWDKYIESQSVTYKNLAMINNKYIRFGLEKVGLSHLLHDSKQHQLLLLNLLKCETHNEIMTNVLEKNV